MPYQPLTLGLVAFLGLAITVQAEEPAAQPEAVTTTSPTADAAASAAQDESALEDRKKAEAKERAAKVALIRAQGYKPTMHKGEEVYCKREVRLGSRFEGQTCGTLEDIARIARESHDSVEEMQRQGLHSLKSQ